MKTNLITRGGWDQLEKELSDLWRIERPYMTDQVREAAALGDRSENAEYKEGKRRLRQIDGRIRFLGKRLDVLQIVEHHASQNGKVFFGAWVAISNDDDKKMHLRIVGPDEIHPETMFISVDSPMSKALLGKQVDDEISFQSPSGLQQWTIDKIQYQAFEA